MVRRIGGPADRGCSSPELDAAASGAGAGRTAKATETTTGALRESVACGAASSCLAGAVVTEQQAGSLA